MKQIISILIILNSFVCLTAQNNLVSEDIKLPPHPRILLQKGQEKKLMKVIKENKDWTDIHNVILDEADNILTLPTNERAMIGKRLLSTSNENLRRIFFLSYAYRMTGQNKYFKRAEAEMLKAASFSDWNPSHFLDTGEMTMALAIGYDWLYDKLSAQSRTLIAQAIIEKGLKISYVKPYDWFVTLDSNWNQVCHAGMLFGSLAVWENDKELSCRTVNRALDKIHLAMDHYGEGGAYPEGVGYWEYGTSFNLMFLEALQSAFGHRFNLDQKDNFIKSAEFIQHMTTPSLQSFNFADNGNNSFKPTMLWFSSFTGDQSLMYNQISLYRKVGPEGVRRYRLAPALLMWGKNSSLTKVSVPKKLMYVGFGDNPCAAMRSSWTDSDALYLACKFGKPNQSHGHMDVGGFVFESHGVPWAIDLGPENYTRLEEAGWDIWSYTNQNGDRWKALRYSNKGHNTLSFNDELQLINGMSTLDSFSDDENYMNVIGDLTPVYANMVDVAKRKIALVEKKYAVIEDVITTKNRFTQLTWNMLTPAEVKIISDNELLLVKDDKSLSLKVESNAPIRWNIHPAEGRYTFESKNPGINIISFDTNLERAKKQTIRVILKPL